MDRIVWHKCLENEMYIPGSIRWLHHLLESKLYEYAVINRKNIDHHLNEPSPAPYLTYNDALLYRRIDEKIPIIITRPPAKFPYIGYGKALHRMTKKYADSWINDKFNSQKVHEYQHVCRIGNLKSIERLHQICRFIDYYRCLVHSYLYGNFHIICYIDNRHPISFTSHQVPTWFSAYASSIFNKCIAYNCIHGLSYLFRIVNVPTEKLRDEYYFPRVQYRCMHRFLYRKYGKQWLQMLSQHSEDDMYHFNMKYYLTHYLDPTFLQTSDICRNYFEKLIVHNNYYKTCRHICRNYSIKPIRDYYPYRRIIQSGGLENLRVILSLFKPSSSAKGGLLPNIRRTDILQNVCIMAPCEIGRGSSHMLRCGEKHMDLWRFLIETAIENSQHDILRYLMRFKPHPIYTAIIENDVNAINRWIRVAEEKGVLLCKHYISLAYEYHRLNLIIPLLQHNNYVDAILKS